MELGFLRIACARLAILLIVSVAGCSNDAGPELEPEPETERPNVLIIVADDLGYTDLGSFGGEISTPNLDRLALAGIRFTNFHAGPSCAPTRAMLLTGTDNHLAGMGSQSGLETEQQKLSRNYQNRLRADVPTIAEEMRDLGYHVVASTKWHLGDGDALPSERGFAKSFVLMPGGAGHFDDTPLFEHYVADWREDGEPFELPQEFYTTDLMTDKLLTYIDAGPVEEPFFAYLGYTAPHWPLQAPETSTAKYEDQYHEGWDLLREQRLAGAKRSGVVDNAARGVAQERGSIPWETLAPEEQARQTKIMQVYAGMVDRLDENIGRVLEYLERTGKIDNTIIFFMADNGAEGHAMENARTNSTWIPANFDNSLDSIGSKNSYVTLGPSWARAHAAPFRDSKGRLAEGGIRVPAFVHIPGQAASLDGAYMRVMDLAPTFLQLANGHAPDAMMGRSLLERWRGGAAPYPDSEIVAAETYGRRLARRGDWKILLQEPPLGTGDWQLYNLAQDVGEQEDLSEEFPEIRTELIEAWQSYADEVGVILPETPIYY
ncbi:MAG: sulfatase-like hydrolase/transferase [Pseudomonadales bacterium]|nr:sulfatase-like hydrolase/transferase [Pseudomonadales bacterium]